MPFESEKQRKFLWAKHPEIAKRWSDEYGSKVVPKKKAKKKKKKKGYDFAKAERKLGIVNT
jgi:hypothetical protein